MATAGGSPPGTYGAGGTGLPGQMQQAQQHGGAPVESMGMQGQNSSPFMRAQNAKMYGQQPQPQAAAGPGMMSGHYTGPMYQ